MCDHKNETAKLLVCDPDNGRLVFKCNGCGVVWEEITKIVPLEATEGSGE